MERNRRGTRYSPVLNSFGGGFSEPNNCYHCFCLKVMKEGKKTVLAEAMGEDSRSSDRWDHGRC